MNFAAGRITLPLAPALLALLVLAYLLPGLVGHDPWKTDDAIGIGIVHQMLEHGRWIVPYLAGEPFLEDGPFHYWIAALAANVFGLVLAPHDGARLASGVMMAAVIALVHLAGRDRAGRGRARRAARIGSLAPARISAQLASRIARAARNLRRLARGCGKPRARTRPRMVASQRRPVCGSARRDARLLGADASMGDVAGVAARIVDAVGGAPPHIRARHAHADRRLRRFVRRAARARRSARGLWLAAAPAACAPCWRRRSEPAPRRRQRARVVRRHERGVSRRDHVAGVVCDDDWRPFENRRPLLQARARLRAAVFLDGIRGRARVYARVALAGPEKRALGVPRRDFLGRRHHAALVPRHDLDPPLDRLRKELPSGRAGAEKAHPCRHALHRKPRPGRSAARGVRLSRRGRHAAARAPRREPLPAAPGTSPPGRARPHGLGLEAPLGRQPAARPRALPALPEN